MEQFEVLDKVAAQIGWRNNQRLCAEMYDQGDGVTRNKVKALKWYFLYLCQYDTNSYDEKLINLRERMTASEIDEAEKLALQWIEAKKFDPAFFKGLKRNPLQ